MLLNQAKVNEFKEIFAPLNTRGSSVLAEIRSPKGLYLVVDSFVERLDTDLSNNAGRLGVKGLPRAFGLYLDGNRIAALPREGQPDTAYFAATLDALPYRLRPGARTLLLGAAGGFRAHEARGAGASMVEVVEPDTVLRRALVAGLGPVGPLDVVDGRRVLDTSPLALTALERDTPIDVIDVTREFLAQSETNRAVMSVETLATCSACWRRTGCSRWRCRSASFRSTPCRPWSRPRRRCAGPASRSRRATSPSTARPST